jgi:hypothetical protein
VVLGKVCLNETLFEDVAALAGCDRLAGSFSRNGAKHVGVRGEFVTVFDASQFAA